MNPGAVELIGDDRKKNVGAPVVRQVLGTIPREHSADVGDETENPPRIVEHLRLVDAADHDGVADSDASEGTDPTAQTEKADILEG